MTVLLTLSILIPFVVAVMLGWSAHRRDGSRAGLDQFRMSGDSLDAPRIQHELDAIRTRFQ